MSERHDAVDRYAGSYMNRLGSSSRNAELGNTPSVMGTVTVLPVRSSVIVMVSGTSFPSSLTAVRASSRSRHVTAPAQQRLQPP